MNNDNVVEGSLESKLKVLEEQLAQEKQKVAVLEAKDDAGAFNPLEHSSANTIIKSLVEEVLGKKFIWRLVGFGKHQFIEMKVPEELEDPSVGYDIHKVEKTEQVLDPKTNQYYQRKVLDKEGNPIFIDGRPRFRKPHPKAGEFQGDIRSVRVQDEDQLKNWLLKVKENITNRFKGETKNIPNFV